MSQSSEFVPLKNAAALVGESAENTRLRLKNGRLAGEQRGGRKEWFVESKSLAKLLQDLGRRPSATAGIDELAAEVRRLAAAVDALKAQGGRIDGRSGEPAPRA